MILDYIHINELSTEEQADLDELVRTYNYYAPRNSKKLKYYEGHIGLADVNIGIAIPDTFKKLEVHCEWGTKCVDVLAARSMFDGFVGTDGEAIDGVNRIIEKNMLTSEYMKACRDELKFGSTYATLNKAEDGGCDIRFHSPLTSAALWDGEKNRIKCGFAIVDTMQSEKDKNTWTPSHINYYRDDCTIVLAKVKNGWSAERVENIMGRPLMEGFIWNATTDKPFGRSRIKASIRSLIDAYVRTLATAAIALEFDTTPQKYLLGVTDEQFDAVANDKFRQYIGAILTATKNPETGENPVFGQLQQGSLAPHVDHLRMIATQFCAATGLSVVDTGVLNNANPTSSEAIIAQTQTLILLAEQLNASNGESLKNVIRMAQAISQNKRYEDLTEEEYDIIPHFKNPAMPSVAATADAAIKIATSRQEFASTDVFLEMIGFSQADIRRIKSQEQRARGQVVLESLTEET